MMIQVENLVKRYGGRCAVDHLSFTVEDGTRLSSLDELTEKAAQAINTMLAGL